MTWQTLSEPNDVLVWQEGSLGRIRLNRPKALNSLTLDMVRTIARTLAGFEQDRGIATVLVDGAGERGLCAGGDIRAIHDSGKADGVLAKTFFKEEYAMNAQIAAYTKPYVAFMDGITMGGGVGLSAHGTHRIVTERTRHAMPETGIGFFPDVGGTWLLARAPGEIGTYLGLTGIGIGGADTIYAGMADLLIPSAALPEVSAALTALAPGSDVNATLAAFAQPIEPPLAPHRALIDAAMKFDTVPEILAALKEDGSDFALATLKTLGEKSPTSLVLTLRLLRLARASDSLQSCLDREFTAVQGILAGVDFYEGVRAAVIDKDRNPKWQPASLAEVTEAMLKPYF
jgi:enoyl-CoA hydratase